MKRILASLWRAIPIILVVAAIMIIVGFSDRGFDFTDEGFYYLSYTYPVDQHNLVSWYHYFGSWLLPILQYQIPLFRLSVLLGLIVINAVFSLTLWPLLRRTIPLTRGDAAAFTCFLLLGNLQVYAISPVAWSYNHLNLVLLVLIYGICLRLLFVTTKMRQIKWLGLCVCATLLIELDFFVKFGSAVAMLLLFGMLIVSLPKVSWRRKGLGLASIVCSLLVPAVCYFTLVQSWADYRQMMQTSMSLLASPDGIVQILQRYGDESIHAAVTIGKQYWPSLLLQIAAVLYIKTSLTQKSWAFGLSGLAWSSFFFFSWQSGAYKNTVWLSFDGQTITFYLTVLLLLLLQQFGFFCSECEHSRDQMKTALAAVLLFVFPVVGAVGTTNPVVFNMMFGITGWLGLYLLLLCRISLSWQTPWFLRSGVAILSVFIFSQFYYGHVIKPYGNIYYRDGVALSLTRQTISTPVAASTLKLDAATHGFLEKVRTVLTDHGFQPGGDIIGLFDMPGLVYALDGKSPGISWYFDAPSMFLRDVYSLKMADHQRVDSAFILIKGDFNKASTLLTQAGVNFPGQYHLIGKVMLPHINETIEIWQPARVNDVVTKENKE